MIYNYTAFEDGKRLNGQIEARDLKDCESKLLLRGLRIIKIEKQSNLTLFSSKKRFSNSELHILFYSLHILMSSKMTVAESLSVVSENYKKRKRQVIENIYRKVIGGMTFAESIKSESSFPKLIYNLIYTAERSANLPEVLKEISEYYFEREVFKNKLYAAISYPILLFFVTLVIVNFLIFSILPSFSEIFENAGANLPISTSILILVSKFMRDNFIFISALGIVLISLVYLYLKTEKGQRSLEKFLLKFKFYRDIEVYNFINLMSFLLKSKLRLIESIEVAADGARLLMREELSNSLRSLYSGVEFSESLKNSKIFDEMTISLFKTAEKSSNLSDVMSLLKRYYDKKVEISSKKFLALLEPVIILILSLFVGFVVLSVALPMFEIINYI